MSRIYFNCVPFDKGDVTLALESGVDGVIVPRKHVEEVSGLSRCPVWAAEDTAMMALSVKADEEAVLERLSQLSRGNQAPIIVDLLFGLPFQDEACWQRDIADFLDSGAHGVDLYQLIEMQGTPMARLVDQGKQPPPAATPLKARLYGYGAQALEAAGRKPGEDVTVVSIDGTRDALQAIIDGKMGVTVESSPFFGPLACDTMKKYAAGEKIEPWVKVEDRIFTKENAAEHIGEAY